MFLKEGKVAKAQNSVAMTLELTVSVENWGKQRTDHFQSKRKVLGQFFTPIEVARFMVNLSRPFYGIAVDPAVGDGTFLKALMTEGYPIIYGVDIDPDILKECQSFLGRNLQLIETDALLPDAPRLSEVEGKAHLVIGNPPFSSKYCRIKDQLLLKKYSLGRRNGKRLPRTSQSLEIIFLERFIQLAGKGGQISIILPDGILANPALQYVRDFVAKTSFIKAVVSLPRGIFHHTTSKTHILHLVKKRDLHEKQQFPVVLAIAEEPRDLHIILKGVEMISPCNIPFMAVKGLNEVIHNLTPEFYHPSYLTTENELANLLWPCIELGELLDELKTGGTRYGNKREFAENGLRYISARTITPLGINFSREERYITPGSRMDLLSWHVRTGDVLLVRVGVGCAGRVTLVTGCGDEGVANDYIHILRSSKIHPGYLALFLQSRFGQLQLEQRKHGVGTVSISKTDLKTIKFPIIDKDKEFYFGKKYEDLVKLFVTGESNSSIAEQHKKLIAELETFIST